MYGYNGAEQIVHEHQAFYGGAAGLHFPRQMVKTERQNSLDMMGYPNANGERRATKTDEAIIMPKEKSSH